MILVSAATISMIPIFCLIFFIYTAIKFKKDLKKESFENNVRAHFNNIPEKDFDLIKEKALSDMGYILEGNSKYEYCVYVEKGHKFIFYPHKNSQGNISTRIRVANPAVVTEEKTDILKDFIRMGFHCKSLPKNYK